MYVRVKPEDTSMFDHGTFAEMKLDDPQIYNWARLAFGIEEGEEIEVEQLKGTVGFQSMKLFGKRSNRLSGAALLFLKDNPKDNKVLQMNGMLQLRSNNRDKYITFMEIYQDSSQDSIVSLVLFAKSNGKDSMIGGYQMSLNELRQNVTAIREKYADKVAGRLW